MSDASRASFEAFHSQRKSKGAQYRENLFARHGDGSYADDSVQRHWWTWQNALKAGAAWASPVAPSSGAATPFRQLDYIKTEEDLRLYVQACIEEDRRAALSSVPVEIPVPADYQILEAIKKSDAGIQLASMIRDDIQLGLFQRAVIDCARVVLGHRVPAARPLDDTLLDALRAARSFIYCGGFPLGWNIDRIDAAMAMGHVGQGPSLEASEAQQAAGPDQQDARRWQWFAGDCDGNAQDDLIQLLSKTILSKAEIDALVDSAMADIGKQP